ncbi:uncharacterized protein PHACADRAFT_255858 [Phanerochaete carnosa HHB-10118-sp]|uniref:3-hydroxyisobutyryl-CoA hydrolase n=1 Tax=Phanerochaete carnosa (strain HHB-10118-sp) TaxID=650164 RepID=K5WXY1_PHACS|nr:uncharacterized protein PHACADRAFT_255858 [Phanerochaete carnosa HHB-10118-sp]EKM55322.1 hypothetical protein PHACADRAFT_255858 [Phanerochaete carnosa HHB-10118-sp]
MMVSSQAGASAPKPQANGDEPPVVFETVGQLRKYVLNRPQKLNALDTPMLKLLRPYVEDWSRSQLSKILVGQGVGRAFCAGGDVAGVVELAADEKTRPEAIDFFKREFELDYLLAAVAQVYVAVMDGITMGGGVGLAANAPFRIATENTLFAMPETKIGYSPDVGATFFLSRLDGEIGTYLGLTGESIKGRDVYELGLATHFIPSRRIPALLERLASLDRASYEVVDSTIEECSQEREPGEPPCTFISKLRTVLDSVFSHNSVEEIIADLKQVHESHEDASIRKWAEESLAALDLRSPTSLKVALLALRKGRTATLHGALQNELNIATAYCSGASPDFKTGVTSVLVTKTKERPAWSPSTVAEVRDSDIAAKFFGQYSPQNGTAPSLELPKDVDVELGKTNEPMRFALPTEQEIHQMVAGSHRSSGSTGLTKEELVQKFVSLRKGKTGVREKVVDVVERKCVEELDKASGKKYLKWKGH